MREEREMRKERGFSLIELLIVVGIIGIIAALAIPNLRRARQAAQAGSAVQSLRTLTTAEILYYRKGNVYGILTDLAPDGTLDTNLSSGFKSGYTFAVVTSADLAHFYVNADPFDPDPLHQFNHFYADDSNVIRAQTGVAATVASAPIQ